MGADPEPRRFLGISRLVAQGGGALVAGSPIRALGYLVEEMARHGGEPLHAGEFITTGTLTEALPAVPGEIWTASVKDIDLADIEVRLVR